MKIHFLHRNFHISFQEALNVFELGQNVDNTHERNLFIVLHPPTGLHQLPLAGVPLVDDDTESIEDPSDWSSECLGNNFDTKCGRATSTKLNWKGQKLMHWSS